jgi:hypothetical protein|tara:strand:- start:323 stop:454 length:132 start_codon:yes stop_codon:yes gene_type:complete
MKSFNLKKSGTDIENITASENGILSPLVPTADAGTYTHTIKIK